MVPFPPWQLPRSKTLIILNHVEFIPFVAPFVMMRNNARKQSTSDFSCLRTWYFNVSLHLLQWTQTLFVLHQHESRSAAWGTVSTHSLCNCLCVLVWRLLLHSISGIKWNACSSVRKVHMSFLPRCRVRDCGPHSRNTAKEMWGYHVKYTWT
jgi:predicted LPLAT superfamily acyltransferase